MLFTPPMFIYIVSVARRRHEDCFTEDHVCALLRGFFFFMPHAIVLFVALFRGARVPRGEPLRTLEAMRGRESASRWKPDEDEQEHVLYSIRHASYSFPSFMSEEITLRGHK